MCLITSKPRGRGRNESPRPSRVTRHSAKSVSRYDDEHVIGPRSTAERPGYIYGPRGDIVGVDGYEFDVEPSQSNHLRASAPSTSRYDDEHLISSRPHRLSTTVPLGMSKSVSGHDEHLISSVKDVEKEAAKKDGSADGGLIGMFSVESSHEKEREERRIGEKLVGSAYGPGSFLAGKSSLKQTLEAKKAKISARPREYGLF